jgi:hypothetical protein
MHCPLCTPDLIGRVRRASAAVVACLALVLASALDARAQEIAALHFDGEPVGFESALAGGLESDARHLLARVKSPAVGPLDPAAAAFQRGARVRAFAEALHDEATTDPDALARSHARRAWILAELGAVNFAAEHANLALPRAAARGETLLARAWMFWCAGNFAHAARDAQLAAAATPPPPAWALAAWQQHRTRHTAAAAQFTAAKEPDDSSTAAFLDYADLARAAGAFQRANDLVFRALNALHQQREAEPATPPDRLTRARLASRDLVHALFTSADPERAGPELWRIMVASARDVCEWSHDRAAWERYLGHLVAVQSAVSDFDYADFDLHGDLARGERDAALPPTWRERLAPSLANPRIRFSSRLIQTHGRIDQHPAAALWRVNLEAQLTPAQLTELADFAALYAKEAAVLAQLRAALPADVPRTYREVEIRRLGTDLAFRRALAQGDLPAARRELASLTALRTPRGDPVIRDKSHALALARVERAGFATLVEKLLRYPHAELPAGLLAEALALAQSTETELRRRHGDTYATRPDLPADVVADLQRCAHVRLLGATATRAILPAAAALDILERLCARKNAPAYPDLADARELVRTLPADPMPGTPAEKTYLAAIKEDRVTPDLVKTLVAHRAAHPDELLPHLLLALAHWRVSQEAEAEAVIAALRSRVRAHPPSARAADQVEANNAPVVIVKKALDEFARAAPADRARVRAHVRSTASQCIDRIARNHGGAKVNPAALPPRTRVSFAYATTALAVATLDDGQFIFAFAAIERLRELRLDEPRALLEAALRTAPFTHDLRDEASRQLWRDLTRAGPIPAAEFAALPARVNPLAKESLSLVIAASALALREGRWADVRSHLRTVRTHYGLNAALLRQVELIERGVGELAQSGPDTAALERERQAWTNDYNRDNQRRIDKAVAWDRAPEGFKENWDLSSDKREWDQLGKAMEFAKDKIATIGGKIADLRSEQNRLRQARLDRLFRDLNALAAVPPAK